MPARLLGVLLAVAVLFSTSWAVGQPFPTPVQQAIALLTSGTTPFSIVGINASGYINWGTLRSAAGYGIRDNAGVIEAKDDGGSWAPIGSGGGGGAPTTATYVTQTPSAGLSAEQALSLLATGILKSTTTTGVVSIAVANTDYAAMNVTTLSSLVSVGTITTGTWQATPIADAYIASAATWNAGVNPFDQDLNTTDDVEFDDVIVNDITINGTCFGCGGGNPFDQDLNTTDTPTFAGVTVTGGMTLAGSIVGSGGSLSGDLDFTGNVILAPSGGTGFGTYAVGDLLYADTTTTLARLADVSAGRFLRSGGVSTAPAWSTVAFPNTATTGDLLYASGANQYANLADVAAGSFLRSGGVSTAPVWSTTTIPNSATTGDLLYASASNVYSNLAAVATGRVLGSMGTSTAPAWLTNPSSTTFEVSTAFLGPGTEAAAGVLRLANTATVSARNAGNTGDLVLLSSTAADRVLLGGTNTTGFTLATGSNNLFIQGTTPTISSGFGTTPTIAGTATAFKVTVGGGGDTTGVVLFAFTWSTAPSCVANNQTSAQLVRATPTTTQVTLAGTMNAADVVSVLCFGY